MAMHKLRYARKTISIHVTWKHLSTNTTHKTASHLKLLVCIVSPLPLFECPHKETCLCLVIPECVSSDSTSACPWLWSEGMLPACWLVCKFDLIFGCSQCTIQYYCPPLAFISMHSNDLLNVHAFCKFHYSQYRINPSKFRSQRQ